MLNAYLGLFLGVAAMAAFGLQDFLMAKSSKAIGIFKTSLGFNFVSLILLLILSIFLFGYNGMSLLTFAILIFTAFLATSSILTFTRGLEIGNVSVVATIASAWGAITAILSVIFFGEVISHLQILYVILIVVGTVLTSLDIRSVLRSKKSRFVMAGTEYAILTLFIWGLFFFLLSYLTTKLNWFVVSLFITILTTVLLAIYCTSAKIKAIPEKRSVPLIILIGIIATISIISYNLGVTYGYTAIVAPVSSASPIITVSLALVILKEKLQLDQKIGIILVIAGIILLGS
jgi:uncharacterized membrane protein